MFERERMKMKNEMGFLKDEPFPAGLPENGSAAELRTVVSVNGKASYLR